MTAEPGWRWWQPVTSHFDHHGGGEHLAPVCEHGAAWLTGQSSYRHSQLSPGQRRLLGVLAGCGYTPTGVGFPYRAGSAQRPYRREPLAAASWRNGTQFVAARHSRPFARELHLHLQPLLERTSRHLVLLCGSAGLQLLATAARGWRLPDGLRVLVIAIGPVGRPPVSGRLQLHVIRGDRDRISRLGCRLRSDLVVPGGHLDTVGQPRVAAEVLRLAAEFRR